MNKPNRYFFPAACIALLALAFLGLFSGCTAPADNCFTQQDIDDSVAIAIQEQQAFFLSSTQPQIPLKEFDCMKMQFEEHFAALKDGAEQRFADRVDTLTLEQLNEVLPSPNLDEKILRGITFHYGLDRRSTPERLKLALEFVMLKPEPDSITYQIVPYDPSPFLAVEDKALVTVNKADWLKDFHVPYMEALRVKRNSYSTAYTDLVNGIDHEAYTFRWEGSLESMITDNPEAKALFIWHVSEPEARNLDKEEGFRHDLAMHAVDGNNNVLMNNDPTTDFKMRGSDLGSACPPNCTKAQFFSIGLPAQPKCGVTKD
jgi:hypothetical protein